MSGPILSAAGTSVVGHQLWHLVVVVAAPFMTFGAIRVLEGRQQRKSQPPAITPLTLLVAVLGFAASGVHLSVTGEHFNEWFLYGIFFVAASAFQAGWSVLVLLRPSRDLFLLGALANDLVVLLFIASRTTGMPFGPEAFQPERLTTAGVVATVCELALVAGACWRARQLSSQPVGATIRARPEPAAIRPTPNRHPVFDLILWTPRTEPSADVHTDEPSVPLGVMGYQSPPTPNPRKSPGR